MEGHHTDGGAWKEGSLSKSLHLLHSSMARKRKGEGREGGLILRVSQPAAGKWCPFVIRLAT